MIGFGAPDRFIPLHGHLPPRGEYVFEIMREVESLYCTCEGHIGDVGFVSEFFRREPFQDRKRSGDVGVNINPIVLLSFGAVYRR